MLRLLLISMADESMPLDVAGDAVVAMDALVGRAVGCAVGQKVGNGTNGGTHRKTTGSLGCCGLRCRIVGVFGGVICRCVCWCICRGICGYVCIVFAVTDERKEKQSTTALPIE